MTGVVISSGFVVSPGDDNLNADSPIVGYHNLVTTGNISATTEDPDNPASFMGSPVTHQRWKAGAGSPSSEEYITVDLSGVEPTDIDYLAIARHNLGSSQAPVSVEIVQDEPGSPADWQEVISQRLLPNDNPTIFRFDAQTAYSIRLRIQESQATVPLDPTIAVVYVGKLLLLQRRIFVGHTPIPYGRRLTVANHKSTSGNFLGRIVLGKTRKTNVSLRNLTSAWYRSYMDPFIISAQEKPFFFGWRPGTYPYEAGYAWLTSDAEPTNQLGNGMMSIDLEIEGIA